MLMILAKSNTKAKNLLCRWLGHKFKLQEFYHRNQCQRCWVMVPARKIDFECQNCGSLGFAYVDKPVDIIHVPCPNCQCKTLMLN